MILQLSGWRVSFWAVAGLGVAMIVAVLVAVPETLPAGASQPAACASSSAPAGGAANRRYVGYVIVSGLGDGRRFAYVATSAFVLQSMNGLSPIAYSVDFAANAAG